MLCFFFFFFQAEDGIRDLTVTGVQTCALPIFRGFLQHAAAAAADPELGAQLDVLGGDLPAEAGAAAGDEDALTLKQPLDRKSTRLNSSHSQISYAVFCLKKKKKKKKTQK